ncbi:hypothetical protein ACP4OV_019986 [Aristida adscensionis]
MGVRNETRTQAAGRRRPSQPFVPLREPSSPCTRNARLLPRRRPSGAAACKQGDLEEGIGLLHCRAAFFRSPTRPSGAAASARRSRRGLGFAALPRRRWDVVYLPRQSNVLGEIGSESPPPSRLPASHLFFVRRRPVLSSEPKRISFTMKTDPEPEILAQALQARKSVVQIIMLQLDEEEGEYEHAGTGTGFIVRCEGTKCLVMTCAHVIHECYSRIRDDILIRVCGRGWQIHGMLLQSRRDSDIALIYADGLPEPLEPLRFVDPEVSIGTTAFAIGYMHPAGIERRANGTAFARLPAVCPGTIAAPVVGTAATEIIIDCPFGPGCSGSPAWCNGGVVGVINSSSGQMTHATSSRRVNQVIRSWLRLQPGAEYTFEQLFGMFF